jgi:hypothetical protein
MTMPRAIALLLLSIGITAAGIFLIVVRVQDGLVNPNNPSRGSGAFTGENAATPQGVGSTSRGAVNATATAVFREITAAAATRNAVLTPFPSGTGDRGSAVAIGETVTVGNSKAGQTRRGWLSFQLPEGMALDALIWQPLGSASAVVITDLR